MKNFEELELFIKNNLKNNSWIDKLKKAPYNLQSIKQFELNKNWYILVYNLFSSDLSNKIVKQCRGTVVEVLPEGTVNVICAPYLKFFDINDPHADKINWDSKKLKCQTKCVAADTIIETENGLKTIKEVVEGSDKLVLSVNDETEEVEFKEIENRWFKDDPDSEWYEVETSSGKKIKITGNDRLKLINGAYRRVDKLKIGDKIIVR